MPCQSMPAIVCKGPSPSTVIPSARLRGDPSWVHLMFPPRKVSPALGPFLLSSQTCKRAAAKDELWAPLQGEGSGLPFVPYTWRSKKRMVSLDQKKIGLTCRRVVGVHRNGGKLREDVCA